MYQVRTTYLAEPDVLENDLSLDLQGEDVIAGFDSLERAIHEALHMRDLLEVEIEDGLGAAVEIVETASNAVVWRKVVRAIT
jgi:hypothetical protein